MTRLSDEEILAKYQDVLAERNSRVGFDEYLAGWRACEQMVETQGIRGPNCPRCGSEPVAVAYSCSHQ